MRVFLSGGTGLVPCTPAGCIEILDRYGIEVGGRRAVVVVGDCEQGARNGRLAALVHGHADVVHEHRVVADR